MNSVYSEVLLINMPFSSDTSPSLGLSLVKQHLALGSISASILYANLLYSKVCSHGAYRTLARGYPDTSLLLGEWVFAESLFSSDDGSYRSYFFKYLQSREMGAEAESIWSEVLTVRGLVDDFLDSLLWKVLSLRPRVVGFTSTFQQHFASLALAKRIRSADPRIGIVFGGANCVGSMGYETLRCFSFVDAVVSGEGDEVVVPLFRTLLGDKSVSWVQGVYTRENVSDCQERTDSTPSVSNLDALPFPNFDDFFEQRLALNINFPGPLEVPLETSRGCWWGQKHHCTFCGLNAQGLGFRRKSPERAFEEILYLNQRYPGITISAVDNILSMDYIKTVLPRLAQEIPGLDLFFEVKSNLTRDQLSILANAGVRKLQPGIESFGDGTLKLMKKGVTGLQNVAFLKWCRELGITPGWNIIWGFPSEEGREYGEMCELLPLLTHLPPPSSVSRLRLDRFSPNYERSSELGFGNVRPAEAYRHLYPFSATALSNIAYFFDFDYENLPESDAYVERISLAVSKWRDVYPRSNLYSINTSTALVIVDTRPVAAKRTHILTGLRREVFLACRVVRKVSGLASPSKGWDEEAIKGILGEFASQKLMAFSNGHCLSLPLHFGEETT